MYLEWVRAVSVQCSSSTKGVQKMVGSCKGSAEGAEQQVWGDKTEATLHFSSPESSAVFPWILIFHYSGQETVFVPPTLPQSREHLEYVTEMCHYPQLHYLKMDIKLDFPLDTKACIVPQNASSILQWKQPCLRSELTSKTLCSMRHFLTDITGSSMFYSFLQYFSKTNTTGVT